MGLLETWAVAQFQESRLPPHTMKVEDQEREMVPLLNYGREPLFKLPICSPASVASFSCAQEPLGKNGRWRVRTDEAGMAIGPVHSRVSLCGTIFVVLMLRSATERLGEISPRFGYSKWTT